MKRVWLIPILVASLSIFGCSAEQHEPSSQTLNKTDSTTLADESLEQLLLKADAGDATAQFTLGRCYYKGDGVSENKTEALKWFHKSAEQGDKDAIKALERIE